MSIQSLVFKSISPEQLKLNKLLLGRKKNFSIEWQKKLLNIQLSLHKVDTYPTYSFEFEIDGLPFQIFAGQASLDLLLPSNICHFSFVKLPHNIKMAILQQSIAPILQRLSQSTGFSCLFVKLVLSNTNIIKKSSLIVQLNNEENNQKLIIPINQTLIKMLSYLEKETKIQQNNLNINFLLFIDIGYTTISYQALQDLECGDIIFFDSKLKENEVIIQTRSQLAFIGTKKTQNKIQLSSRYQNMNNEHEESNTSTINDQNNQQEVDISQVPVTLSFEVGNKYITFAELQQLQPGYIFELEQPIDKPVIMKANGKKVGLCELVEINGRLGVYLTELNE